MDTTMTQQRNRLQSSTTTTNSSSASGMNVSSSINSSNNGPQGSIATNNSIISQSPPPIMERSTNSFANLLDGFTSRVSGERSQSAASTPSSSSSSTAGVIIPGGPGATVGLVSGALGSASSIASLTSIGSTANAFYSSIGLAFNSLTSPITAAAAAASATTAEAAAVVVAAASAISNHLSSPTSTTPPHGDLDDEDEDCEEDDEEEEDDGEDSNVSAPTPKKSWSEIKATVNDIRKQMSNLSSMVPTNIQFRTLSDGRVRCYFLSTPPNGWETTLLYTDINITSMTTTTPTNADDLASPDSPNDSGSIRMGSPPASLASSPTMQSTFLSGYGGKRWDMSIRKKS